MKIGIANTSQTSQEILVRILGTVPHWKICCKAATDVDTILQCALDCPDLLLIDVNFLVKNGLEVIDTLIKKSPCAIVITTDNIKENASIVFEAMGHGALDVVKIPDENQKEIGSFIKKFEQYEILLGKTPPKYKCETLGSSSQMAKSIYLEVALPSLILMGASTGGPLALAKILSAFPQDSKASIIIIQHVDEQFARGFVEWLQLQTKLTVCLAENGVRPAEGVVLVAGTNHHLVMTSDLTLKYTEVSLGDIYHPSIDVLFSSVAKEWPEKSIAVLLTGMGKDGAVGLKALRDVGWRTFVQEEESCVIFGMPKAALDLEAAEKALDLDNISKEILTILKDKEQANPWRRS